jgi:hypothetical protein
MAKMKKKISRIKYTKMGTFSRKTAKKCCILATKQKKAATFSVHHICLLISCNQHIFICEESQLLLLLGKIIIISILYSCQPHDQITSAADHGAIENC